MDKNDIIREKIKCILKMSKINWNMNLRLKKLNKYKNERNGN